MKKLKKINFWNALIVITDDSGKISFKEFCDMIKPETEEEKQDLKDLYDQFDTDGDGEISLKEFKEGFKKRN